MKHQSINSINFDVGRGIFPSSNAENWLDIMRASRQDPIHNYTYNTSIKGVGDVKTPLPYQAVQGGFNIMNPAVQTVRQIPLVSDKHRVPVKTENKRKDRQATEALFDIRNNTSLNNATRVPPNYYLNKLNESARGKVRMSNTAEAMRVQYSSDPENFTQYLTGDSRVDTYISTPQYSMESFNVGSKDDGILRFADLSYPGSSTNFGTGARSRVETPSYNPFLPQSSQNKSHYLPGTPSYPDERLTRYSGERKYMTKGDRILMAADLAQSDLAKERRQLQAQAQDSLNKAGHAPRMYGADLSKGINTLGSYSLVNSMKDKGILQNGEVSRDRGMKYAGLKETPEVQQFSDDQFNFQSDRILGNGLSQDITGVSSRRMPEVESYVPRSHDLNRQTQIQQAIDTYYEPGISKIRKELNDEDIIRKLYAEQFGNNPHNQKAVEDKGLINKFIDTFKGWFGAKTDDEEAFNRMDISSADSRKQNGNISAKTFQETVKNLEVLLKDDSLSIQQRQAFDKDLRSQIKEYLEDYNDSIKQDLIIHRALNNIAERCIIGSGENRKLDEDKFVKEILQSSEIMDRLDELKIRTAKNLMTEDKYIYLRNVCEDYDADIISNWLDDKVDELSTKFNYRKIKVDPYYTERGVKESYNDGLLENKLIEVVKPVSVLMNGNNEVTRGILIKDSDKDKYMLLQRKEYDDSRQDEYLISKLEPDEVMKILNVDPKQLKHDPRFGDVVDLTFEDHIKLNAYVDKVIDKDFIVVSKNPIHPYQRDLLDDDSNILQAGVISNVVLGGLDNEGLINKEKYRTSDHIIEHSKNIAAFKGNGDDLRIYNQLEYMNKNVNDRVYMSGRSQNE